MREERIAWASRRRQPLCAPGGSPHAFGVDDIAPVHSMVSVPFQTAHSPGSLFMSTSGSFLASAEGRVNEWDSQYAIFLGADTSNICYAFRATLRSAGTERPNSPTAEDILDAAERLELALRSDIGIHGITVSESDLLPRQRERY